MSHDPLISKIRCHSPNMKRSTIRNRNYLVYIATRDGVDLSPLEKEFRNFDANSSVSDELENEQYLKYIHERPRSCGLFGNIDCNDPEKLGNDLSQMTRNGKNIYQGIVSLTEKDALILGFDQKTNWVSYIKKVMPDIGREFDIPIDKLEWTAAVHMEPGHPHCHYMFWRSDNKSKDPFIHYTVQNRCRELLSKEMFQEEHTQEVLNKTLSRDLILDINKDILKEELNYFINGSLGKVPGKISKEDLEQIAGKMSKLINLLPTNGRLVYQLLPPTIKVEIDTLVNELVKLPILKVEYHKYLSSVKNISSAYSPTATKNERTEIRGEFDIKKRLANQVLKTCKEIIFQDNDKLLAIDNSNNQEELYNKNDNYIEKETLSAMNNEANSFHFSEDVDVANEFFNVRWSQTYKDSCKMLYSDNPDFKGAIALLQSEFSKNNVLAIHDLGKIYEKGLGVKIDSELSNRYYEKALSGFQKIYTSINVNSNDEKELSMLPYLEYRIAKMYHRGNGSEINYEKAINWYQKSVNSDNKYAQYSLGTMYLYGNGIEITAENKVEMHSIALDLFKKSANNGNAYASYAFANLAENEFTKIAPHEIENHYNNALKGFLSMYQKQESEDLAYRLGTMYLNGKGTTVNYEDAKKYFEKAIEYKNYNAYYSLGKLYAEKNCDFYDMDKAIVLLKFASNDGEHEYADLMLGKIYADTGSTYFNLPEAITFLEKAHLKENDFAQYKLGKIYSEDIYEMNNLEKAIEYFTLSANHGNEHAQFALGKIYADKESPFYDISKSLFWFTKSAEQNNSYAQYQLGKIYADKESPLYNIHTSIKYLKASASQDNEHAQFSLGNIYADKECPFYDINKAIYLLEKAADKDNSYAQVKLAMIYLYGKHSSIPINKELGMNYLMAAIENNNDFAKELLKSYNPQNALVYSSYRMIMNMFSSLVQGYQKRAGDEKFFSSQTKALMKAEQKRLHGFNQDASQSHDD